MTSLHAQSCPCVRMGLSLVIVSKPPLSHRLGHLEPLPWLAVASIRSPLTGRECCCPIRSCRTGKIRSAQTDAS